MKAIAHFMFAMSATSQALIAGEAAADPFSSCLERNHKDAVVSISYSWTDDDGKADPEQGTGFIVSPAGYIITAAHVIHPDRQNGQVKSRTIKIRFANTRIPEQEGWLVHEDSELDVALLRIQPNDPPWTAVPIGKNSDLKIGDDVWGLGFPNGGALTVFGPGQINASSALVSGQLKSNWIQTDLALNRGESGSPVFDMSGAVVAIADAYYQANDRQSISYLVPIQFASTLLEERGAPRTAFGPCGAVPNRETETRADSGIASPKPTNRVIHQSTEGSCSPAVGEAGNITINCSR